MAGKRINPVDFLDKVRPNIPVSIIGNFGLKNTSNLIIYASSPFRFEDMSPITPCPGISFEGTPSPRESAYWAPILN